MELQRLPVGVDHDVDVIIVLRGTVQAECETVRVEAQIGCRTRSVPGNILPHLIARAGTWPTGEGYPALWRCQEFVTCQCARLSGLVSKFYTSTFWGDWELWTP